MAHKEPEFFVLPITSSFSILATQFFLQKIPHSILYKTIIHFFSDYSTRTFLSWKMLISKNWYFSSIKIGKNQARDFKIWMVRFVVHGFINNVKLSPRLALLNCQHLKVDLVLFEQKVWFKKLKNRLNRKKRVSTRELASELKISRRSVQRILKNYLK